MRKLHDNVDVRNAPQASFVTAHKIAHYERVAAQPPLESLTTIFSQELKDFDDLRAQGERDLASGAKLAAVVTALRIGTAPVATDAEKRLKNLLLMHQVLPAANRLDRGDLIRVINVVRTIEATRTDSGQIVDEAVATANVLPADEAKRGPPTRPTIFGTRARPRRTIYAANAAFIGQSGLAVIEIFPVLAHAKALRREQRSKAADGACAVFAKLALKLCAVPTVDEDDASTKVEILEEILPDMRALGASFASVAQTSIVIERQRWPRQPNISR